MVISLQTYKIRVDIKIGFHMGVNTCKSINHNGVLRSQNCSAQLHLKASSLQYEIYIYFIG